MKRSIALLSNINLSLLQHSLQQQGFGDVYVAGYNQWQSELLNTESDLYAAKPAYAFIYLDPGVWDKGDIPFDQIKQSIAFFAEHSPGTTLLISEMVRFPYSVTTYIKPATDTDTTQNRELRELCSQYSQIRMVGLSGLVLLHGYSTVFDNKYWYLGSMKFSLEGNRLLAQELRWLTDALEGKGKKVVVLDLDNTLWGGVLGEDGLQGIQLSGDGKGLIFREFQQLIKQLSATGVLLALCSKNNEEEVRTAFATHPEMQLGWSDFVALRVNWLPKHENLQSIARELNLGLDSFVFIDDSPAERELVRQSLPQVTVPEFPADITRLNQWMLLEVIYPYFARTMQTAEDTDKSDQYRRNTAREQERSQISYELFIRSLSIQTTVDPATEQTLQRIAQLSQKTNQFNMTLKRYTEAEITRMYKLSGWKMYTCRYSDKFGDEGIVGAFLIRIEQTEAEIDNFLLSCRALGRQAEMKMLEQLIEKMHEAGIKNLKAKVSEGERNAPALHTYRTFGFTETGPNEYELQIE